MSTTAPPSTISLIFEEQVEVPMSIQSLETFRQWTHSNDFPAIGRIDFLHGKIEVDMQAEDLYSHGSVKVAVIGTLFLINDQDDLGELFSDRTRIASSSANLSREPDIVFLKHESIASNRVRLIPKAGHADRFVEIEGGPDLVVEIVSDSSVVKDTQRLPRAYFQAGVNEFWLIDARGDEVLFQIQSRGAEGFEAVALDENGYQRSRVVGRSFRLQRTRNRHGHWKYDLDDAT